MTEKPADSGPAHGDADPATVPVAGAADPAPAGPSGEGTPPTGPAVHAGWTDDAVHDHTMNDHTMNTDDTSSTDDAARTRDLSGDTEPLGRTGDTEPLRRTGDTEPVRPDAPAAQPAAQPAAEGAAERAEPAAGAEPGQAGTAHAGTGQPGPGYAPPPGGFFQPGGFQPPPGGFLPPPTGGFPPPGPTGGTFATRYGLVRPQQGRWFAGVAAAIGRATNTDPVLWRVLFAGLTLFGGVGVLVYALGWLLIPSEGDSASPAEALVGRGRSSTSTLTTIVLGIVAVIGFGAVFSGNARGAVLGAAVVAGVALLVSRGNWPGRTGRPGAPGPGQGYPDPAVPGQGYPEGTAPGQGYPDVTGYAAGAASQESPVPPGQETAGFRPPFAPHGPYASTSAYPQTTPYPSTYAQSLGYAPEYPYPGMNPPPPPPPVKPPRERSRLGRLVLSLLCLVLGTLVVVDVAGASVPAAAYVASALGTIGLGLVIGAWLGRARWLILPGILLVVALAATLVPGNWNHDRRFGDQRGNVTWSPRTVDDLRSGDFRLDVGNGVLDLSRVDFAAAATQAGGARPVTVDAGVDAGNLTVILPPNVDVDVTAAVDNGSATVLGRRWSGVGNADRTIHDTGADGSGGGQLELTASVDLGKLEVRR